jgi:hypothetical protein
VWWLPAALFVLGSLADAAITPTAALIAPACVALWLAATASHAVERFLFALCSALCIGLTLASLADFVNITTSPEDAGAVARTMALGALFVTGGLAWLLRPQGAATRR